MKSRLGFVLTTAAAFGSAAFLIVSAHAQQGPASAPPPPAAAAQPMPMPMPPPGSGPHDFGPGQGRFDMGPRDGARGGPMARFSPQDRAAFFDAHIAAVRAGLQLTPDQEKLWGPVEQAVRDAAKEMIAQRQKLAQEGRPTDPVERLQRQGDALVARGEALLKIANAAQPLWASLSQDQKRRLPMLMHGMRGGNGMGAQNGMRAPNGMRPQNGMPPQDTWHQGMRSMMQQPAPRGGEGDGGGL